MTNTTSVLVSENAIATSRLNLPYSRRGSLPEVSARHLEIQGRLGTGSFSVVFEVAVSMAKLAEHSTNSSSNNVNEKPLWIQSTATAKTSCVSSHGSECWSSTHTGRSSTGSVTGSINGSLTGSLSSYSSRSIGSIGSNSSSQRQDRKERKEQRRLRQRRQKNAHHHHHAMKRLRAEVWESSKESRQLAIQDFMLEAELLARLPVHPNIIQITAVSKGFFRNPGQGFLLLERMDDSLEHVLTRWESCSTTQRRKLTNTTTTAAAASTASTTTTAPRGISRLAKLFSRRQLEQSPQQEQQPSQPSSCCLDPEEEQQVNRVTSFAVGTALAMQHLHQHNIIFRDLKPSNIGVQYATGKVCLFDFGLARSVPAAAAGDDNGDRLMTGVTGTMRYMAPEVAMCKPYGLSADVYSFGIVLWQICLAQRPYESMQCKELFFHTVVELNHRPNLKGIRSSDVQQLIAMCWDANPALRPTFSQVLQQLQSAVMPHLLSRGTQNSPELA